MRKIAFLFLLIGISAAVVAQPINKPTLEKTMATAKILEEQKDYINALEWYEKAYDDSEDRSLLYPIAMLAYEVRDYRKVERRLSSLLRRDEGAFPDAKYYYGKVQKMNGNPLDAITTLKEFIVETSDPKLKRLAEIELAGAEMARDMPQNPKVSVAHAGKDLNTRQGQYAAVLVGSNEAYFAGFDSDDVLEASEDDADVFAKIFRASKTEDKWEEPEALDQKINRVGFHNSHVFITPDGNRMFLTRSILYGNEVQESKIFLSRKGEDGWQGVEEVNGVNGDWVAKHPVVGELFGQEVLFFVSDKDGGQGGFDIYYSTLQADGSYNEPTNLGPAVNTAGNEQTPFYRDGTLYFSTDARPSLGGYDIYFSDWDGTKWSQPVNMGRGFNSEVDDLYFTVDEEGYKGFLVSNRDENRSPTGTGRTCCNDIFEFEIAKISADIVVGTFTDAKEVLKGATVSIAEIIGGELDQSFPQTNTEGNVFQFPLGIEKSYKLVATHPGYYPDSVEVATVGLTETKSYEHRFYLKALPPPPPPEPEYDTIAIDEPIELSNIYYDFDDDVILKQAEQDLELIFDLMTEYPEMKVELRSHTDARGNDDYNKQLSQSRTESARRWLIRKGIARNRIEANGYGETDPKVVTEKSAADFPFLKVGDKLTESYIDSLETTEQQEAAHQLNRRTEFKIIEGPTSIRVKRTRLKKNRTGSLDRQKNFDIVTEPKSAVVRQVNQQQPIKVHKLSTLYGKKGLTGVPIMHFEERVIDFGKVKKGDKRTYIYKFTNLGDTPLKIDNVDHCECTEADYPRGTFESGESGEIKIIFDSTEKDKTENIAYINIMLEQSDPANDYPIIEELQYKFEIEE